MYGKRTICYKRILYEWRPKVYLRSPSVRISALISISIYYEILYKRLIDIVSIRPY